MSKDEARIWQDANGNIYKPQFGQELPEGHVRLTVDQVLRKTEANATALMKAHYVGSQPPQAAA